MKKMPMVYIASPYTLGDQVLNVRFQEQVWHVMWGWKLCVPHAPLWNHYQHHSFPLPAHEWIAYDDQMILRCDALVRLDARWPSLDYHQHESYGADHEVELAEKIGIPVFYKVEDVYAWLRENPQTQKTPSGAIKRRITSFREMLSASWPWRCSTAD